MGFLQRAWRGEASFWPVYWIFGVFGAGAAWALCLELLPAIHRSFVLELVGLALTGCYLTWAGVLMWRCAANNVRRFAVFTAPMFAFAWLSAGILMLVLTVWLGLAGLGLPVGLESPD